MNLQLFKEGFQFLNRPSLFSPPHTLKNPANAGATIYFDLCTLGQSTDLDDSWLFWLASERFLSLDLVWLEVRLRCTRLAGVRVVAVGRAASVVWAATGVGTSGVGLVTVLVEWMAMLVVIRVLRVRPGSS